MGKPLRNQFSVSPLKEGLVTIQYDKVLDMLMKLGLTELQGKTYLALTRFEQADVKTIAEVTRIARQDLYRIIPTLEKLGLVERIIATPIVYRAIPLSEGSMSLFQKRSDEYASLKSSLELLIAYPQENSNTVTPDENETEFIITSERKRLIAKLEKAYGESTNIDMMIPGNAIDFMVFTFYDSLMLSLSKNGKIRVLAKNTDLRPSIARKLQNLKKNPNFEVKFIDTTFEFGMAICDNREVNIAISNKEVPSLWTNNRQIVNIIQMMFENQWNTKSDPEHILQKPESVKVKQ